MSLTKASYATVERLMDPSTWGQGFWSLPPPAWILHLSYATRCLTSFIYCGNGAYGHHHSITIAFICPWIEKKHFSLASHLDYKLRNCEFFRFRPTHNDSHTYCQEMVRVFITFKVLKHFVYIWHGCGMHSKWVWSLNHDMTTSLGLRPPPYPNFPKTLSWPAQA